MRTKNLIQGKKFLTEQVIAQCYISTILSFHTIVISFKVLTIEFRRGELIHLETADTYSCSCNGALQVHEIASESNSSQLSSNARQSNNANSFDPIRSMHSAGVCCIFLNERGRAVCQSFPGQERARFIFFILATMLRRVRIRMSGISSPRMK